MARAATPAIAALVAASVPHEVFGYQHDPRNQAFGDEAVTELACAKNVEPEQIFKTLVVQIPSGLAVAVVPVPAKLSLKAVAAALGAPKAAMADPAAAARSSGYVLGGISPLGQRKALPTVIDETALLWDVVWCSAGKRGLEIGVAPDDLIRLTDAVIADIQAV
ncbi:aminoacyl-tRNA deacylase [Mycobacterium sp. MS1601]|uniref:aminoacyl-tRNA deacylase n=1 Tax=Mycobacterium sp. MS1601 TaxID=1936029 RepID=UPI00097923F6|nr:aminoacyl-tRNA deacylase [Mycobacterium sp. MS1601]AQA06055.1 aminoacyl-tRNA deacylase [Mycobacterium sp. MS1601]